MTISDHNPALVEEIKAAAKEVWPFTEWNDGDESLRAYAEDSLCAGETEEQFTERLSAAIWQANGCRCTVSVNATYMEGLPYETHCLDKASQGMMRIKEPTLQSPRGISMARTTLTVEIQYNPRRTDPEGLASAMDRLMETALSIPGVMDEYDNPKMGEFFVAGATGNPPQPRPTVVVSIAGGVLQEAYSSELAVRLLLVDWDSDGCDSGKDTGVVEVTGEHGRSRCAST